MKYVYIMESLAEPGRYYVGGTIDLKRRRFAEHNNGESTHTNKFRPWKLVTYIAFSDHKKADEFEVYLKSGSVRALTKKHL